MFGKILSIKDDLVIMENTTGETETNIINYHVVFSSNNRDTVGEIISVSQKEIHVLLIGEFIDGKFSAGVLKKPSLKSGCRLIYKNEVELLLGGQDISKKENLYIGKSSTYDNFNICGNTNDFLNSHFAILGNTGSGKSCGTARIIQNLFYYNDDNLPINSHIAIFDVYGEYNNTFSKLSSLPGIGFRSYTTSVKDALDNNLIRIPTFLLNADDLALLLGATEPSQVHIIDKTLSLVAIF
ncbi:MAG: ATP-binding protein, partial [Mollicutes bacterium]|nr:ATP-binding protein [Mollicutes bacterium]